MSLTARPRGVASLRLAARLARRETVRRPARTLLVALLVALPVAGMAVSAVLVRTDHRTPAERFEAEWGTADVYATPMATEEGRPTFDELLPAGTRSISYRGEYRRVLRTTAGVRTAAEITELPMADPLVAPVMQITSGRVATAPGEVFLTTAVAADLGVDVGDTVRLERPETTEWRVVGLGERRAARGAETVVLGPGTRFPWRDDALGASVVTVAADLPADVTENQLASLASFGGGEHFGGGVTFAPALVPPALAAEIGAYAFEDDNGDDAGVAWSWVFGAVVLTVAGIVIAAAFAAGARRQLTTIGQLATNGASPAVLRRVLFLQGTWTGLLGAVLGLGLAAVLLGALDPHVDRLLARDVGAYDVRLADLVPIVALGVLAATIAALVPAGTTARVPILAALAGRRPLRPVPARLTLTGVAVGGAGLGLLALSVVGANDATSGDVWAFTAVLGGVAVLLGACTMAPGYASILEPLARRLRGVSRLAARSLARQRTRTGAVVSAVCATGALAIAASALVLGVDAGAGDEPDFMRADEVHLTAYGQPATDDEDSPPTLVTVPEGLVDEVSAALPGAEVHRLTAVGAPDAPASTRWTSSEVAPGQPASGGGPGLLSGGPFGILAVVADDTVLGLYDLPPAALRVLTDEGIVGIGENGSASFTTDLTLVADRVDEAVDGARPPIDELLPPVSLTVVAPGDLALRSLGGVFMTVERARALGLEAVPARPWCERPRRSPTTSARSCRTSRKSITTCNSTRLRVAVACR